MHHQVSLPVSHDSSLKPRLPSCRLVSPGYSIPFRWSETSIFCLWFLFLCLLMSFTSLCGLGSNQCKPVTWSLGKRCDRFPGLASSISGGRVHKLPNDFLFFLMISEANGRRQRDYPSGATLWIREYFLLAWSSVWIQGTSATVWRISCLGDTRSNNPCT